MIFDIILIAIIVCAWLLIMDAVYLWGKIMGINETVEIYDEYHKKVEELFNTKKEV